jgi:hypothetical protein
LPMSIVRSIGVPENNKEERFCRRFYHSFLFSLLSAALCKSVI